MPVFSVSSFVVVIFCPSSPMPPESLGLFYDLDCIEFFFLFTLTVVIVNLDLPFLVIVVRP